MLAEIGSQTKCATKQMKTKYPQVVEILKETIEKTNNRNDQTFQKSKLFLKHKKFENEQSND